ncbi:MAG: PAS domain S-box protein [Candidatus Hydrogenedentota bacterium]
MPSQFGVVDDRRPSAGQSKSRGASLVTISLLVAAAIQIAAITLLILVDPENFGLAWYWLAAYVIVAAVILVYAAVSAARARFKWCLVAGMLLASVDPIARLSERIVYLDWFPVFGRSGLFHDYALLVAELAGYVIIFLALLLSMIEVFRARDRLVSRNTLLRERIEAQEALAATGDRLVSIFDSVPDFLLGLDMQGTVTFANQSIPASSTEDMVGRGILEFTHRDDRGVVLDAMRRVQESRQTVSFEARGVGRDSFVPYSCRMGPVISGSDVTGFTVVARDVTDLKAAEAARKRAEERYRFLAETISDVIWKSDDRGIIQFISPSCEKQMGYSPEDAIGQTVAIAFLEKRARKEFWIALGRAKKQGLDHFEVSGLHRRKGGSEYWAEALVTVVRDDEGNVVYLHGVTRDVSSRKELELKLQQSEKTLRSVLDNVADFVSVFDLDGRFIDMNKTVAGLTRDDVMGRHFWEFVPDEERERVKVIARRVAEGGEAEYYDVRGIGPNGTVSIYQVRLAAVKKDGVIDHLVAGSSDITALVAAQEASREAERRYGLLAENSVDMIWTSDADGIFTYVSPSCSTVTGFSPKYLVGRKMGNNLVREEDRAEIRRHLEECRRGERNESYLQFEMTRKDGTRCWLEVNSHAVRNEDGSIAFIQGCSHDITDRKRMEEELREAERKYRLLAENSVDMIWTCDADGIFTYVSPSCLALTGYSSEEFIGLPIGSYLMRAENPVEIRDRSDQSTRGGWYESYLQFEMIRKDGIHRWFEVDSHAIHNEDGPLAYIQGCSRDITDRKRMEEELREAERKYRLLAENSMDVIWTADAAGRLTYVSPSSFAVNGYKPEEWIGLYLGEGFSRQDDREEVRRQLEEALRNDREESITQIEMQRRDGTPYWSETHARVIRNDDGSFAFIQGTSRDITDRKRIEAELREAKELYELLAQNASDVVWLRGSDGRLQYVSPSVLRLSGYTPDEWKSIGVDTLIRDKAARERVRRDLEEMAAGTRDQSLIEAELVRKDGKLVWFETTANAIRDPKGGLLYVRGATRDVSARHRSGEVLHAIVDGTSRATGEAFFPVLVENLAKVLGVRYAFVAELREGPEVFADTLAYWDSDALETNFGYALEGTPCANVAGRRPCVWASGIQSLFPDDQFLVDMNAESYGGAPLFTSDGAPLGILAVVGETPLESPELVESVLSIFAGRASAELERLLAEKERRRLEEHVRHAQKLESLGVLAGGIAHDFNNLLVGVLGNAGLIKEGMSPDTDDYECVREIESAAMRASELTNQMLAYAGKGRFVIQPLDLSAVVKEMLGLLKASVSKKAMLQFEFKPDLPQVEADPAQIRQVIMNLITNASEALEDREGIVNIRTGVAYLDKEALAQSHLRDELAAGDYVFLEVSDSGVGMGPEVQSKIFDPFFTTKFAGRGLGLAAVLGVVRGHKGTLQIESNLGEGTTFRLFLPPSRRPVEEAAAFGPAAMTTAECRGRILVVEDEPVVRSLAARVLEKGGFETQIAEDGQAALEILESIPPSEFAGVLLDLLMPRMAGKETFDAIRALDPDIPIVLTSGYTEQDVLNKFKGARVDGFVHKPYETGTLLRTMIAAVERRGAIRRA